MEGLTVTPFAFHSLRSWQTPRLLNRPPLNMVLGGMADDSWDLSIEPSKGHRFVLISVYVVFSILLTGLTYFLGKAFLESRLPIYAALISGLISAFTFYRLYLAFTSKPKAMSPKGIRRLSYVFIFVGAGALLLALFHGGFGLIASGTAILGIGLWNRAKLSRAA